MAKVSTSDTKKTWADGPLAAFCIASLKGISQVLLLENALTGLVILIALAIANLPLGVIALVSALLGTWVARILGGEETVIKQGLYGYNAVLTGLALPLFLTGGIRWWIALAGAVVSVIVTAALAHAMRNLKLPVLTIPYILLTWFLLLASFHLDALKLSP